jgi:tetratricopeptide (TPR) repeat protein
MGQTSRMAQILAMLEDNPNDSFLRYALAMEHQSVGQDDQALAQLRELIQRDASYVPAYLQAGQILVRLGESEQACQILEAGIRIARQANDAHAAGEMSGLLSTLR